MTAGNLPREHFWGTASVEEVVLVVPRLLSESADPDSRSFRESMIGLVILLDRIGDGAVISEERLAAFWRDVDTRLGALRDEVGSYVRLTLYLAEGSGAEDDRFELYQRRSAIQILIDRPQAAEAVSGIDASDLEELDAALLRLGELGPLPPEYRPRGVPATHWWWFSNFEEPS